MKSRLIKAYFDQLESQRKDFFQYVTNAIDNPWHRPQPEKWSAAETVFHVMLLARLLRKVSVFYLPIMRPYAQFRKTRPYLKEARNIYKEYQESENRPMKAPFVLVPPANLDNKYSMKEIQALLFKETEKLYKQLADIEEPVAGQIRYPDPVADYPNVMQSIHLLAIHENHHFDLTKKYYEKQ